MRDVIEPFDGSGPGRELKGRHVLITLVAFFGVIFAVNGYFLSEALRTHTGVVAVEPYRKGLAYNGRIAASDRQAALGWRDDISVAADGTVEVRLSSPDQAPIAALAMSAILGRPANAHSDQRVALRETAPGVYRGAVQPLAPGTWTLSVEAQLASSTTPDFRVTRRIWLKP